VRGIAGRRPIVYHERDVYAVCGGPPDGDDNDQLWGGPARSVKLTGIATLVAVSPTSLNFGNALAGEGAQR
jgi:hypothetical protein